MKIWWCQEHDNAELEEAEWCWINDHCRMVPMRLIPDNAAYDEDDEGVRLIPAALDGETP